MSPMAENLKQYKVKFNAVVSFSYDHVIYYVRAKMPKGSSPYTPVRGPLVGNIPRKYP